LKYLYMHPKPCVFGHADNVVAGHGGHLSSLTTGSGGPSNSSQHI